MIYSASSKSFVSKFGKERQNKFYLARQRIYDSLGAITLKAPSYPFALSSLKFRILIFEIVFPWNYHGPPETKFSLQYKICAGTLSLEVSMTTKAPFANPSTKLSPYAALAIISLSKDGILFPGYYKRHQPSSLFSEG